MATYTDHFSINNIPFGIASNDSHSQKAVTTRFEDTVIFLDELAKHHPSSELDSATIASFSESTLNPFISLPTTQHTLTRSWIQTLLSHPATLSPSTSSPISHTTLHLPLSIGDFTDFSCSRDHALNASAAVFGTSSLPPGFEHFPIGYHGRCSSIVVSGTDVVRPKGTFKDGEGKVVFGDCGKLDFEMEMGAVVRKGREVENGEGVSLGEADEWIFGVVLVDDWSARDIQTLEMTPLGPLNGKSFLTSISPWIITLEALKPFKTSLPPRNQSITMASYLQDPSPTPTYNISLTASLQPNSSSTSSVICESKFSDIYWTLRDLVAHQTVNGCTLRTGDLLATGTISGEGEGSSGCLMEVASKGGVDVGDGRKRVWLEDGDVVCISAVAGPGVGFGECVGKILPVRK